MPETIIAAVEMAAALSDVARVLQRIAKRMPTLSKIAEQTITQYDSVSRQELAALAAADRDAVDDRCDQLLKRVDHQPAQRKALLGQARLGFLQFEQWIRAELRSRRELDDLGDDAQGYLHALLVRLHGGVLALALSEPDAGLSDLEATREFIKLVDSRLSDIVIRLRSMPTTDQLIQVATESADLVISQLGARVEEKKNEILSAITSAKIETDNSPEPPSTSRTKSNQSDQVLVRLKHLRDCGVFILSEHSRQEFVTDNAGDLLRLYFQMNGAALSILTAVYSDAIVNDVDLLEAAESTVAAADRLAIIGGDGGTGKSTLLAQLAVRNAERGNATVFVSARLRTTVQDLDDAINILRAGAEAVVPVTVYIDDIGAANSLVSQDLVLAGFHAANVKVVLADRMGRLSEIMNDPDFMQDPYYPQALEDCLALRLCYKQQDNRTIDWLKHRNIEAYLVSPLTRCRIIDTMFDSLKRNGDVDGTILATALDHGTKSLRKREFAGETLSETYLRICDTYNQMLSGALLDIPKRISFDWDNWKDVFMAQPIVSGPDTMPLAFVFPIIAALDLFKVPASLEFLGNLTKTHPFALRQVLAESLRSGQPAALDQQGDSWFVTLKHDTVSELYFKAPGHQSAQESLRIAVNAMDENMALVFERSVFRRRYLKSPELAPAGVQPVALMDSFYRRFEHLPRGLSKAFWPEQARLYAESAAQSPEEISARWAELLQKVLNSSDERLAARLGPWGACFWSCVLDDVPPPNELFTSAVTLGYRDIHKYLTTARKSLQARGADLHAFDLVCFRVMEHLAAANANDSGALNIMAKLSRVSGDLDAAEKLAQLALNRDPGSYMSLGSLAEVYRARARKLPFGEDRDKLLETSRDYYAKAAYAAPPEGRAVTYCALGNILRDQGHYTQARAEYERALEAGGNACNAWQRLGILYSSYNARNMLFDLSRAVDAFQRAFECHPSDPTEVLVPWGITLYVAGDLDRAEEKFKAVLVSKSNDPKSRHYLALIRLERQFATHPYDPHPLYHVAEYASLMEFVETPVLTARNIEAMLRTLNALASQRDTSPVAKLFADAGYSGLPKTIAELRLEQRARQRILGERPLVRQAATCYQKACQAVYQGTFPISDVRKRNKTRLIADRLGQSGRPNLGFHVLFPAFTGMSREAVHAMDLAFQSQAPALVATAVEELQRLPESDHTGAVLGRIVGATAQLGAVDPMAVLALEGAKNALRKEVSIAIVVLFDLAKDDEARSWANLGRALAVVDSSHWLSSAWLPLAASRVLTITRRKVGWKQTQVTLSREDLKLLVGGDLRLNIFLRAVEVSLGEYCDEPAKTPYLPYQVISLLEILRAFGTLSDAMEVCTETTISRQLDTEHLIAFSGWSNCSSSVARILALREDWRG